MQQTTWHGGSPVVFHARQGQNGYLLCHFVLPCLVRMPVATGDASSGTSLQRPRRRGSKAPCTRLSRPSPANPIPLIPLLSFPPRSWRRTERRSGETLAYERKQKLSSKDDYALPSLGGDLLYPDDTGAPTLQHLVASTSPTAMAQRQPRTRSLTSSTSNITPQHQFL
jgi:hypothetical protein